MNNKQRQQILKWIEDIQGIRCGIEDMRDTEETKYDNLPEGLQESERGDQMQHCIESLECAIESINDAIAYLDEARI